MKEKKAKKKDTRVYIIFDHDGDLVLDNVVGLSKARKIAKEVYGHYERQY